MAKNSALEDYLAKTPADRHAVIRQFDALIRRTVPALKPCITHGLLGYGPYHYQYASGREGDAAVIGLAAMKRHYSLYVCCADAKGHVTEQYRKELPKAKLRKGCIRFGAIEDLPLSVLRRILRHASRVGGMGAV